MHDRLPLSDLPHYIYGTTRLGDEAIPFEERVAIVRAAIDGGAWLHTSHQYGNALQVIREAFDQDRSKVPPVIFKIGWDSVDQIRDQIRQQIDALGIKKMAIGQLCLGGAMAEELRTDGPGIAALNGLKSEDLVDRFVLETWPWTSEVPLAAIRAKRAQGLIDGFIFYLNPLQRFVTNELWGLIREQDWPVIAMRTVGGGDVNQIRDNDRAPAYLRERAAQIAPLYAQSGCASWLEFCIRFVFSYPQVRATVGATARREHLDEFLALSADPLPLNNDLKKEIERLQWEWSDSHDRHAEPWSM